MQTQQPQNAAQKSETGDQLPQESEPPLSPALSLWQIFHNPEAFQRMLFTRLTLAQRAQAGPIRPLRPLVEPEKPENREPEPAPLHDTHQDKAHQRNLMDDGSILSRGRHSGREKITVNHHDFSSRFRER